MRDLRIGERPRSVKYIRSADLAVARRREVWGEKGEVGSPCVDAGGYCGVGTLLDAIDCIDEADAECECLGVSPFAFW